MTFSNAKVGDKVWSLNKGWGIVEKTGQSAIYTFRVRYNEEITELYTEDGKMYRSDKYPTLFWDELVFEVPKKPLPKLEVDTKILVWCNDGVKKEPRHFSHFGTDGKVYAFIGGKTSFSLSTTRMHESMKTTSWDNYEIVAQ